MTSDELQKQVLEITHGDLEQARDIICFLERFIADLRKGLSGERKS